MILDLLCYDPANEWIVRHYKSNGAIFVGTLPGAIAALKQAVGVGDE